MMEGVSKGLSKTIVIARLIFLIETIVIIAKTFVASAPSLDSNAGMSQESSRLATGVRPPGKYSVSSALVKIPEFET
ncbi:hypothetical protein D3C71_1986820 [compost metagenome]